MPLRKEEAEAIERRIEAATAALSSFDENQIFKLLFNLTPKTYENHLVQSRLAASGMAREDLPYYSGLSYLIDVLKNHGSSIQLRRALPKIQAMYAEADKAAEHFSSRLDSTKDGVEKDCTKYFLFLVKYMKRDEVSNKLESLESNEKVQKTNLFIDIVCQPVNKDSLLTDSQHVTISGVLQEGALYFPLITLRNLTTNLSIDYNEHNSFEHHVNQGLLYVPSIFKKFRDLIDIIKLGSAGEQINYFNKLISNLSIVNQRTESCCTGTNHSYEGWLLAINASLQTLVPLMKKRIEFIERVLEKEAKSIPSSVPDPQADLSAASEYEEESDEEVLSEQEEPGEEEVSKPESGPQDLTRAASEPELQVEKELHTYGPVALPTSKRVANADLDVGSL